MANSSSLSRGIGLAGAQTPVEFPVPFFGPEFLWYDDFLGNNVASGSSTADATTYRIGGTGTNVITAHEDTAGGGGKFVTGATDNDEFGYQLNGSGVLCRARTASAKAQQVHFHARVLQSSITSVSSYFGLWVKEAVATTPLSPLTGTQPIGIGFVITNGTVNYITKPHSGSAVTATATGFGAIATATFYNFDLYMDGDNNFIFQVNGKTYLTLNSASTPLSGTVGLSPAFGIKTTGGSAAKYIVMQRLYTAVEGPAAGR